MCDKAEKSVRCTLPICLYTAFSSFFDTHTHFFVDKKILIYYDTIRYLCAYVAVCATTFFRIASDKQYEIQPPYWG